MFDTIILLTGEIEASVLAGRLRELNPALTVIAVVTANALAAVPCETLAHARLVGFATPVIVPPAVLAALGYGAYNFHPGPPDYPGLCPAQFALYDGANTFGVTVHEMVEKVDAGPIVATVLFPVTYPLTVRELEIASYRALTQLFAQLSPQLANGGSLQQSGQPWSGRKSTRRKLEAMCALTPDMPAAEIARRVAAFGLAPFGIKPRLGLHGFEFSLSNPPPPVPARRTDPAPA